jgi:hypothetical protein
MICGRYSNKPVILNPFMREVLPNVDELGPFPSADDAVAALDATGRPCFQAQESDLRHQAGCKTVALKNLGVGGGKWMSDGLGKLIHES